jgi:glycosyltransferase involved in cell wall biosynthesis
MYADKQLDFLLAACEAIRQRISDFHVIFIGNGPEEGKIERAAQKHDWIHYVGPIFARNRAMYFMASQVILMPGLVGLAIVDSFVAGTPLFTTDIQSHSPEISYLEHGMNGVMTSFAVNHYADAGPNFESEELQKRLREGMPTLCGVYTLEAFRGNGLPPASYVVW